MKIDVLIPFHENIELLLRCLKALCTAPPPDATICLVDDGSPRRAALRVRQMIGCLPLPIRLISLPQKAGFIAAVNQAWAQSKSEVSVVLNNDTVPAPDLLPMLTAVLYRYGRIAAVAPESDNPADLYQYRPGLSCDPDSDASPGAVAASPAPYLTAMCLAIRRRAVGRKLLFDPVYSPGYFEDLDLSCWLRASGWSLAILKGYRIHHTGQATFKSEPGLMLHRQRNYATFSARWAHLPEHRELDFKLRNQFLKEEQSF